jgi:hypothetical protein
MLTHFWGTFLSYKELRLEPNYDKLISEIWDEMDYPCDGEISDLLPILPVLKRYFEQFEKDVRVDEVRRIFWCPPLHPPKSAEDLADDERLYQEELAKAALDEVMYNTPLAEYGVHTGFTPICPGIADKATKVATFIPALPGSLLEALRAGAKNPVVSGDVCPVCANGTDICSYCARNFEGVEND